MESESVGYTEVRRGERSKHNAVNGTVGKTCQKTYLEKSTLDPCMHTATDIEDDDSTNSEPSPALNTDRVTESNVFNTENNMGQPGSNQKEEPDPIDKIKPVVAMVTVVAEPAQDVNCNDPDS